MLPVKLQEPIRLVQLVMLIRTIQSHTLTEHSLLKLATVMSGLTVSGMMQMVRLTISLREAGSRTIRAGGMKTSQAGIR